MSSRVGSALSASGSIVQLLDNDATSDAIIEYAKHRVNRARGKLTRYPLCHVSAYSFRRQFAIRDNYMTFSVAS